MGEKNKPYNNIENIPNKVEEPSLLYAVRQQNINSEYIAILKQMSGLKDDVLSGVLNLNTKTFRSYKLTVAYIKPFLQEQVYALLSLYKHGITVFGSSDKFNQWLEKVNYFFDNDSPLSFLNTLSGIIHVDNRLSAIEYGDNV